MSRFNNYRNALSKIRHRILLGKIIKPINPDRFISDLDISLMPMMLRLRDRLERSIVIKESSEDEIMNEIFNQKHKDEIADILITNKDKAALASANHISKLLAYPYAQDIVQERILNEINEKVFKITTTSITDTLEQTLRGKLKQGYEQGLSTRKIALSMDELKTNHLTIARTEINQSVQLANYRVQEEFVNETKTRMEKKWVTSGNPNTRESHLAMAQVGWIPFEQIFPNGLMFPLDNGPAGEVVNCICSLYTRVVL